LSEGYRYCYVYRRDAKYDIDSTWVEEVVVGGESGNDARPCRFEWIMEIRNLCVKHNVSFWFKQTGARFIKDGRLYSIRRELQHSQAHKAGIDFTPR
jgi:protein gp37